MCEPSCNQECFSGTLNAPLPVIPSAGTSVSCVQLKGGNKDSRAGWLPDWPGVVGAVLFPLKDLVLRCLRERSADNNDVLKQARF